MAKSGYTTGEISQAIQHLSTQILNLAAASWQRLKEQSEVTQEIAKDPFTSEAKEQTATAELVMVLLHTCDRVASATFQAALSAQPASVLRTSFMSALVGVTVPTFAHIACPEEEAEEQAETQADLINLYNVRTAQYGLFPLGTESTLSDNEALLKLAGIRLAEALECPGNAAVIGHGVETVLTSLAALHEHPPLKTTIGQLIAGMQ